MVFQKRISFCYYYGIKYVFLLIVGVVLLVCIWYI
nr:MAG TPA: Proteasome regulatory subunit C-terminal [Caudoviricetes sp.]